MKRSPRKSKQWAAEAYQALEKALKLFAEEYPDPTDDEKLELMRFSVPFAALNRGIQDRRMLSLANQLVVQNINSDFQSKAPEDPVHHSVSFLLGYLDAHIAFGLLSAGKADEIMRYLAKNYSINRSL